MRTGGRCLGGQARPSQAGRGVTHSHTAVFHAQPPTPRQTRVSETLHLKMQELVSFLGFNFLFSLVCMCPWSWLSFSLPKLQEVCNPSARSRARSLCPGRWARRSVFSLRCFRLFCSLIAGGGVDAASESPAVPRELARARGLEPPSRVPLASGAWRGRQRGAPWGVVNPRLERTQ